MKTINIYNDTKLCAPNVFITLLKLLRCHQYIKNVFIFLPLFFALKITEHELIIKTTFAFISFSMLASAVYIFNDLIDIDFDKQHPSKKNRPIASGSISKRTASFLIVALSLSAFSIIFQVNSSAGIILSIYGTLNIAYSLRLKHIAILDVMIIATGFVLRLFVGAFATNIILSKWIVLMTFLLALFMALAKRRDDFIIFLDTGKKMRKVIDGYNLQFLDIAMSIMASIVIVAYIMYSTSEEVIARLNNEYLYLTVIFVILGIMRYLQITFVEKNSGSPTKLVLKDKFLQLSLLAWIASYTWVLYL